MSFWEKIGGGKTVDLENLPGELSERYQVLGTLGKGGMGVVLEVLDRRFDRKAALKLISGRIDPESTRRFEREAQLLASISHPHVLTLFDSGIADGVPFLVSELLEGRTIDRVGFRSDQLEKALLDVAKTLSELHEQGLLHRDIKPENLFWTKDQRVVILDFGLARNETLNTVSQDGLRLGTLNYMAPELFRGEPNTPASDFYAWGVTAYTLFERKLPYEIAEFRRALAQGRLPSLRYKRLDPERPIRIYLEECIQFDPKDRPSSYEDLAKIWARFQDGKWQAPDRSESRRPSQEMFGETLVLGQKSSLLPALGEAESWFARLARGLGLGPREIVLVGFAWALVLGALGWFLGPQLLSEPPAPPGLPGSSQAGVPSPPIGSEVRAEAPPPRGLAGLEEALGQLEAQAEILSLWFRKQTWEVPPRFSLAEPLEAVTRCFQEPGFAKLLVRREDPRMAASLRRLQGVTHEIEAFLPPLQDLAQSLGGDHLEPNTVFQDFTRGARQTPRLPFPGFPPDTLGPALYLRPRVCSMRRYELRRSAPDATDRELWREIWRDREQSQGVFARLREHLDEGLRFALFPLTYGPVLHRPRQVSTLEEFRTLDRGSRFLDRLRPWLLRLGGELEWMDGAGFQRILARVGIPALLSTFEESSPEVRERARRLTLEALENPGELRVPEGVGLDGIYPVLTWFEFRALLWLEWLSLPEAREQIASSVLPEQRWLDTLEVWLQDLEVRMTTGVYPSADEFPRSIDCVLSARKLFRGLKARSLEVGAKPAERLSQRMLSGIEILLAHLKALNRQDRRAP